MNVTITGADDAVDVKQLALLSSIYPFVEWGILLSPKRRGSPRYPSERWLSRLRHARATECVSMRLSLHLCGEASRCTLAGIDEWLRDRHWFGRVQINGYEPPAPDLVHLAQTEMFEFILQVRSEDQLQESARDAAQMPRASLLFDASGGRGIEPARWPTAPLGVHMGYAGGIKPENVVQVIAAIGPVDWDDAWIDMESGVRDANDRFDLDKVRAVLQTVERLREGGAP